MSDVMEVVASDRPRTASHELTDHLIDRVERVAQRQQVSRSKVVRTALTDWLDRFEADEQPLAASSKED